MSSGAARDVRAADGEPGRRTGALAIDWVVLLCLLVSGAAHPLLNRLASGPALGSWIWLALWAPAAGALAGRGLPGWMSALPGVGWSLAILGGLLPAQEPMAGALAVLSLYLAGLASSAWVRSSWSLAAGWLVLGGVLTALPSAGGAWVVAPGADWLVSTLDLSPVVWVCEVAGFDWMRHVSVYEVAGAGDLGPHERLAWSGMLGPLLAAIVAGALALLGSRTTHPSGLKLPFAE